MKEIKIFFEVWILIGIIVLFSFSINDEHRIKELEKRNTELETKYSDILTKYNETQETQKVLLELYETQEVKYIGR